SRFKELEDRKLEEQQQKINRNIETPKEVKYEDDPGSNDSGYYDLQAVPTHQGRSSSSGHYVRWVKRKENSSGNICEHPVRRRLHPGCRVEDIKTTISGGQSNPVRLQHPGGVDCPIGDPPQYCTS
ncbi:ubiquitin carboxyl-terminal hydrolase 14, partial [Tachysurus ichikawai]